MLGGVPHQGGLPGQPVWVTRFGGVSFLHVKAAEWGNLPNEVIKSLKGRELFQQYQLGNCLKADEIDSGGNNVGVESDSRASQLNQTKGLPATTTLKRKAASLFLCVLSDQVMAFWTSPRSPGLHVKTSISLPRLGEAPHLSRVLHFHVNRPLEPRSQRKTERGQHMISVFIRCLESILFNTNVIIFSWQMF